MRLFIAEKKDVAEAISIALGGPSRPSEASFFVNGDHITWLWGHVLRLTDPEEHNEQFKKWSLRVLPMDWPISYAPEDRHIGHLKKVIELATQATELVNAGDPDPEGQRLVDEVIEYAGLEGKPIKRILINDNNGPAILKAIENIEDNEKYRGLSMSALARAVCDQRYGYNLTRCYTLKAREKGYDGVLSVGRVQTPILGLVVARDRAHDAHQKQAFHNIKAQIEMQDSSSMSITADYLPTESDPVDEKGRIIDSVFARKIVNDIQGQPVSILSVESVNRKNEPPQPYNLLALQADAAGLWNYKPKKVLEITQRLRDRYKAITYNRSDCRFLNDERHSEAPGLLKALSSAFGEMAEYANPNIKSKAFNSKKVGAHHAIIPTMNVPNLKKLSEDERRIYELITKLYIAQFYPPAEFTTTKTQLEIAGHNFLAEGRFNTSSGWRVLNEADLKDFEKAEKQQELHKLQKSDSGIVEYAESIKTFTKPPALYSMKTLLKDLTGVAKYVTDPEIKKLLLDKDSDKQEEAGGIGTPATRDSHIDTLFKRSFLAEKGKHIISTDIGRSFHDALPGFAVKPDMTALWHEKQKMIEAGKLDYKELIAEVDKSVAVEIERVLKNGLNLDIKSDAIQCPKCKKGILKLRKGPKGKFWGCSAYPECNAIVQDKSGKPNITAKPAKKFTASSEHFCPDCGKGLVRHPAKKQGIFWWGCSGYPGCKFMAYDEDHKPKLEKK
ncbi:DNA topoisomerase [Maridesulfovibrio ferrireducens]|uniref:DNA topoisomerase n=1 Tax=Maridesulfovibrio ferrireducens TaxID=246191 RepID=UPI001A23DDBF|nr:DNA topoisomerase [Maridesulfovibrio ferrireducens]MBI9112362.1 topoisomerase DNA-binding C4 zinc finger domain-containing protein [Maridesulfovibrio ferrireducens]